MRPQQNKTLALLDAILITDARRYGERHAKRMRFR